MALVSFLQRHTGCLSWPGGSADLNENKKRAASWPPFSRLGTYYFFFFAAVFFVAVFFALLHGPFDLQAIRILLCGEI
jgi:hypothetical protein